jgi:hypothetical protein
MGGFKNNSAYLNLGTKCGKLNIVLILIHCHPLTFTLHGHASIINYVRALWIGLNLGHGVTVLLLLCL